MELDKLLINGYQMDFKSISDNKIPDISFRINFEKRAIELYIPDLQIITTNSLGITEAANTRNLSKIIIYIYYIMEVISIVLII